MGNLQDLDCEERADGIQIRTFLRLHCFGRAGVTKGAAQAGREVTDPAADRTMRAEWHKNILTSRIILQLWIYAVMQLALVFVLRKKMH